MACCQSMGEMLKQRKVIIQKGVKHCTVDRLLFADFELGRVNFCPWCGAEVLDWFEEDEDDE